MAFSKRRIEMGEEAWAEYQRKRNNKKSDKYKSNNSDKVVNWRRRTKLKLIKYLGGKCCICGYNKEVPSAYDFHHKDPSSKEFGIGGKTISFEKLKKEADKCILLCKNCHSEIHDEKYKEQREDTIKKWEEKKEIRIENDIKKNKECPICKKLFRGKDVDGTFCSVECCETGRRKVKERPSIEQLKLDVEELGYCGTGRKYGVSDNAVRKWIG